MSSKILRLGIVGGRRGTAFNVALKHHAQRVKLTAVCDFSNDVLAQWSQWHPGIHTYTSIEAMLREDTCDAVFIATPMQVHAAQAIAALRAGRHVISEVTACITHQEGVDLIAAVEQSGKTYMMAENYTYMRPHMMVLNMARQGVFGELTYAEGMYVHDCRGIFFNRDGSLTWRGELERDQAPCNYYPTHSLGPIAQWLDLGNSDEITSIYCTANDSFCMADYTQRRFGDTHPGAKKQYWKRGDMGVCLLRTKLGRVISLRLDATSARPHHMHIHELQGTRGCFRTEASHGELVWLDGRSPGTNPLPAGTEGNIEWGVGMKWEALEKYRDDFDHPRWKKFGEIAKGAGHGGGDFFELEDFLDAIEGKPNPIDVYTAVEWSSIMWLSAESARTGQAVSAINYRKLSGQPAAKGHA